MEYLERARQKAKGQPLSTKSIIEALLLPIGEEISKSSHSRKTLAQLVADLLPNLKASFKKMHRRFFGELCEKFC